MRNLNIPEQVKRKRRCWPSCCKADADVCVCRVPLVKGKTARESLQEQGLWEEYRKQHPYNPMVKFIQTGDEPMTNDADVSSEQKENKRVIRVITYVIEAILHKYEYGLPWDIGPLVCLGHKRFENLWSKDVRHDVMLTCVSRSVQLAVLLRRDLHWHPSSVFHRHLWHWFLQPVGAFRLLQRPGLQWVTSQAYF